MSCISTHVVHVPLVTDETLLSSPRYGSPEISQLGNCRNSCIDFGDKHLPSGSSQSCSSSQTCSALSTGGQLRCFCKPVYVTWWMPLVFCLAAWPSV
eukprot:jgi/Botrbrau1/15014/Bobra.0018s0112.1